MIRLNRWFIWLFALAAAAWAGAAATRFEAFGIGDSLGWSRCCWSLLDILLAIAAAAWSRKRSGGKAS